MAYKYYIQRIFPLDSKFYWVHLKETKEEIFCSVCGEKCPPQKAQEEVWKGWWRYYCPNGIYDWHSEASILKDELDETASPSVKKLIKQDLNSVLERR